MPGRDHFTDVNGDCMPGCRECLVDRLEAELADLKADDIGADYDKLQAENERLRAESGRLRSVIMLKDARISALEGRRVAMRAVEDPQSCSFYQVTGIGGGEP